MKAVLNGNKLTIEVEIDPKGQPSKSGKSVVVYSSGGFVPILNGELRVNLSIIKKK